MNVLWDLTGTLVHNNKSLGSGDLPEGYGANNPASVLDAYLAGKLPKAYYIISEQDIIWIDGALEAIRLLSINRFPQYIITNQEQIGIGIIDLSQWHALMDKMDKDMEHCVRRWYFCHHAPGDNCLCRKRSKNPGLRLFYQCALDNRFNLYNSVFIGDNISDMVSSKMAGCKTAIMIKTPTKYDSALISRYVDHVEEDALQAAKKVCDLKCLQG